jgi:hypothetical protein
MMSILVFFFALRVGNENFPGILLFLVILHKHLPFLVYAYRLTKNTL